MEVGVILGRLMGLLMGWEEDNFYRVSHMLRLYFLGTAKLRPAVGSLVMVGCSGMSGGVNYRTGARRQCQCAHFNTEER